MLYAGQYESCPRCVEEMKRASRVRELLFESGIPPRFQGCRLTNYIATAPNQETALATAKGYARHFARAHKAGACLVFTGNCGTGKTHLACAVARSVMEAGFSARYITARAAVNMVKETWGKNAAATETEILRSFTVPALLVLDEIGVQFGTEAEKIILFDIINGRYERLLPTAVLSNLNITGLEGYLGVRTVDRLKENGGAWVEFNWQSHRR